MEGNGSKQLPLLKLGSPYRKQGRPLYSKAGKKSIFPALILSLLQAINYDRCGGSLDLNGDRPIEPHPTSNDGIEKRETGAQQLNGPRTWGQQKKRNERRHKELEQEDELEYCCMNRSIGWL